MKLHLIIFCLLFSLLPSCRYMYWGKDVFYQSKIQFTYDALRNDYIRTLRVYDQFTTLGLFDVLWLSAEVRTRYSKEYAALCGYCPGSYEEILQKELAENEDMISFYILASTPHVADIWLTEDETPWTIYLRIDGVDYHPKVLEYLENGLTQPYINFFGKRYTMFRDVYKLSFAAKVLGAPIITDSTRSFALCFHKAGIVDECIAWEIVSPGKARVCCIDNPDVLAYDIERIS